MSALVVHLPVLDAAGPWLLCAAGLATLGVACWPRHDDALDGARRPR